MPASLLIVDDEVQILNDYRSNLQPEFDVDVALSPLLALKKIEEKSYDAIIVDVNMPYMSGFELHDKLQDSPFFNQCPIIFRSSSTECQTLLTGLQTNKSEFLKFDMNFSEIKQRIANQIETAPSPKFILFHDDLKLDLENLRLSHKGIDLHITLIEYKMVRAILSSIDFTISKNDLIDVVWGNNTLISDNNLNSHFTNLRKKIKDTPMTIKALRGKGYKIERRTH